MGLGILEPKGVEHVPGTTRYFDDPSRPQVASEDHVGLKSDTSGKEAIILNPQPSDDPNDPLNWPLWKRDLIAFLLCWAGILATALGPILAANTVTLAIEFEETFTLVALLTGYYLLGAGAAAVFFVPSGRIWGKRHLFLLGLVILIASSVWAGLSRSYGSLLAARIVQGVGSAPYESLLIAAIGDLYYVHQRGVRMAFCNLSIFGGAFFTPIVVGKITESIGWSWTFYLVAIFLAATFPLIFMFCPETAYRREARLNTDLITEETKLRQPDSPPSGSVDPHSDATPSEEQPHGDVKHGFTLFPTSNALQPIGHASTRPKSFWESMSLFDGRKTDERYWVLLLRPFPLLANPAFIWGCLIQGTMIGWTVFIGVIVAALFIGNPYWWGEVEAGYAYTGAFVGALGGFVIAGLLADSSVKWFTKRNNGIYEPEFRLFLVIPMLIIGGIGLFGFSLTAGRVATKELSYWPTLIFFGFEVAGMVIGAVASSLYIVDAYRDLTIEGFTIMIIFKNMLSFALTAKAYDWFIIAGVEDTMIPISIVQVAVCLLTVPMYIFGKRCRSFYARHDVLAMCRLR